MAQQSSSGNAFWYCKLTVKNTGNSSHHANPNNVALVTSDGNTYSYSAVTHALQGKDFPAVDVQPGNSATGVIVFEIPANTAASTLVYTPMFGRPLEIPL